MDSNYIGGIMKRSEQSFPMSDLLCSRIKELWQEGVFNDYSDSHFIIKALYQDEQYFQSYFISRGYSKSYSSDFGFNFIVNLNSRINFLCKHFGKDKIVNFMRNQFSAGKNNYSDKAFFEALAEIHILAHFLAFTRDQVMSAEYEPCLIENSHHNPEARIKYSQGLVVDIEVKTPNFSQRDITTNYLYPATLLTDVGRKILSEYCNDNNITLRLPRVLKFKEFIKSSNDKFIPITDKHHLNILFINWTYTDLWEDPLFEPTSLLCNADNGILITDIAHDQLGIEKTALQKISAFFIYTIPEETLLFSDLRYLFRDRCYKFIVNPFATFDVAQAIHNLTGMAINYPLELSQNITTFFNLENKDWSKELAEIQKIISDNTLR